MDSIRELEDLIIDGFYQGIITGKLDQQKQQLHIMSSIGRDVKPNQLDETIDILAAWSGHTQSLVDSLNAKITLLQDQVTAQQQARDSYATQIEQVRQQARAEGPTKKLPTMDLFEHGRGGGPSGSRRPVGSDERKR
jgi:COP9 signalosome complex subunit 7